MILPPPPQLVVHRFWVWVDCCFLMIRSRLCDSSGYQGRFGWVSPAEYLEALESIWSLLAGEVDFN